MTISVSATRSLEEGFVGRFCLRELLACVFEECGGDGTQCRSSSFGRSNAGGSFWEPLALLLARPLPVR